MNKIKLFISFFEKDFKERSSYKSQLFVSIFSVLLLTVFLYFFSTQFQFQDILNKRIDVFLYMLTGLSLLEYSFSLVSSIGSNLRSLQLVGIYEELLQSRFSHRFLLISSMSYTFVFSLMRLFFYFLIATIFFNFEIYSFSHILHALLIVFTSAISFISISLIGASFVLIFKKPVLFNSIYTYLSLLFCGIIFDVDVWPSAIAFFSNCLPLTHMVDSFRYIFSTEQLSIGYIVQIHIWLILLGIIYYSLSVTTLHLSLKRVKKDGTFYSY